MAKNLKTPPSNTESFCRGEIDRMLKYSQTKVIMPVVTLGLLRVFKETGQRVFADTHLKKACEAAVKLVKQFLGHDVHLGAKYYDAYGLRMTRYSVLKSVGHLIPGAARPTRATDSLCTSGAGAMHQRCTCGFRSCIAPASLVHRWCTA